MADLCVQKKRAQTDGDFHETLVKDFDPLSVLVVFGTALAKHQQSPQVNSVECHAKKAANVVNDWKLSKHSSLGIGCEACHGADHITARTLSVRHRQPFAETTVTGLSEAKEEVS